MKPFPKKSYRELLLGSFKSDDTEEWLDVWFNRPVGLLIAMACGRVGITPNAITIVGIVLGVAAGWMFHYTDLESNVCGVLLLMAANFCDSADGQLARLTDQRSLLGRLLDGFASDAWFFAVYLALVFRMAASLSAAHPQLPVAVAYLLPFVLCAVAGLYCHSRQCALADYYRQIHLWLLKGREGSELDSYGSERQLYDRLKVGGWSFERLYHFFYMGYCRRQELLTPHCQRFLAAVHDDAQSARFRQSPLFQPFVAESRRLMPLTNILTHNTRATVLFLAALVNIPCIYPLFEIAILQPLCWWMHWRHERLCLEASEQLTN